MSVKEYLNLLRDLGCDSKLINHSLAVFGLAMYIASRILLNGYEVDLDLVAAGSILHDVGRSKTHSPLHGYVGARILRKMGLDERIALIVERHVGAGISKDEAAKIGLPTKDYIPKTLEEKIVCYADKLVFSQRIGTIREALYRFKRELGEDHPAIPRLMRLDREMRKLMRGKRLVT